MTSSIPVITIDGAGGTGKGTVCHIIAEKLGWNLLDSGVLYRVLALAAEKYNVALDDEPRLHKLAENLDISFVITEMSHPPQIFLEKHNVTHSIRTEKVGNAASKVSAFGLVRTALLSRQRDFRQKPGLVTDGRDMGTVVFPDAELKIFLTATPEERARRRYNQLKDKHVDVNLVNLIEEMRERDKRDHERAIAPTRPAAEAITIATDDKTISEVVDCIMQEVRRVFSDTLKPNV
jgi:cytidylate kinase